MSTIAERRLDVIDVEVFRKAVENLTNEMAITLMRASGSTIVTDTRDFSTAVFDERGEQLGFSGWVTFHAISSKIGVEETIRLFKDDPDLRPGDAIILNDPYTAGAVHQADVAIVMPVFFKDELVGWSFCNEHVLDIGGSAIGGSAPSARDVWSESLRFPPVKIAPGGVLDPQWERYIAAGVRVPVPVINDLRSMIAACHTAQRKMDDLIERYSLAEFRRLAAAAKELSEQAFREKIARLRDGSYEAHHRRRFDDNLRFRRSPDRRANQRRSSWRHGLYLLGAALHAHVRHPGQRGYLASSQDRLRTRGNRRQPFTARSGEPGAHGVRL
jgi:N-methylhydantoinase B